MSIWVKDPADVAWFQFNWGLDADDPDQKSFLDTGETITSHTVTCDTNLTKVDDSNTSTTVSIQVSGGASGTTSLTQCTIVTSNSNTYKTEKTIIIQTRIQE